MKHTAHKAIQKSIYASLFMSAILANSLVAKETKESLLLSNHALQTQGNVAMLLAKNTTQAKTNSITTTQQDSKETGEKNTESQSQDLLFGRGLGFIGAEIGVGGIGNFGAGIMGGYQYYFPESWQFYTFRHGIRGFASVNWTQYGYDSIFSGRINYNGLFVQVGADWTLEFNPKSKYVWGLFLGLSLGYLTIFSNDTFFIAPRAFVISGNGGASLTMYKNHRIDLAFGSGFSLFAVRYLFMF